MHKPQHLKKIQQLLPQHQLLSEHVNSEDIFTHNSLASEKRHAYILLDSDNTGSSMARSLAFRLSVHNQHTTLAYAANLPRVQHSDQSLDL